MAVRTRISDWFRTASTFLQGRCPGQVIIQYSNACNARCPQCELRVTEKFPRSKIAVDDVKRIIDAAAENGVQALSFTGGEPFLYSDELIELIDYAGKAGIRYTRTGTNGFFLRGSDRPEWEGKIRRLAESLARTDLYTLWISMDSAVPEVHEEMRGLPGVVRGIEKALPIFHDCGLYPAANLGINRNTGGRWDDLIRNEPDFASEEGVYRIFQRAFRRFYRSVIDLGFTVTNTCYPMSVESSEETELESVYGASSAQPVISFTDKEKAGLFRALLETIPEFCGRIRIFSPLSSIHSLVRHYRDGEKTGYDCRGGVDYFFIDAEAGDTFPCGFRGRENLGKYWEMDPRKTEKKPFCRACDWECYRDPSDLLGPFTELSAPFRLWARFRKDATFRRLWWRDVRYQKACSFFCGRKPPVLKRMTPFENRRPTSPIDPSTTAAPSRPQS